MSVENYEKLLTKNISSTYKKCDGKIVKNTNDEAKSIAKKLKINDRVEQFSNRNAYITIKDHKEDFPNTTKCRLVGCEIGIISKHNLENINEMIY